MAALWLVALLLPVSCLLPTELDPSSPIKNLRVDPHKKRLTWDLNGNVSEVTCSVDSGPEKQAINNRYCEISINNLERCKATNYTVTVKNPGAFSASIQYPPQGGTPGAAAAGLACWVHDASTLTCSWGPGPAAPPDVQYRLYWEDPGTGQVRECARYQVDGRGARVRCSFEDISGASAELHRFLVNGTAQGSPLACSEVFAALTEIERLSPPKLTGSCNGSHVLLEWSRPSRLQHLLLYELHLEKDTGPPETRKVRGNSLELPSPGKFVAKMKAQSLTPKEIWSEWSAPQDLGCEPEDARPSAWLAPALLLLGSLLAVGVALLLCRRYSVLQRLFPPIPHMKDPLKGTILDEKLVALKSCEDCPVAQVQVLAEK